MTRQDRHIIIRQIGRLASEPDEKAWEKIALLALAIRLLSQPAQTGQDFGVEKSDALNYNNDKGKPGAPYGNKNAAKDYVSKSAFKVAKSGGKNAGLYNHSISKPDHLVKRSAESHRKTAELHKAKIANPQEYAKDWKFMSKVQQKGLINKWRSDYKRNQEQSDIELGILDERNGGNNEN